MFEIDSKIQNDTIFIDSLELCELILMNDAKYPWFTLVPRIAGAVELVDIDFELQKKILAEINYVSRFLKESFTADKINIASLGNVVKQLHIHVLARYENDHSFPNPVWCDNSAVFYNELQISEIIKKYNDFKGGN